MPILTTIIRCQEGILELELRADGHLVVSVGQFRGLRIGQFHASRCCSRLELTGLRVRCWTASIPGPAGRAGLTGVCGLRCKGVLSASEIYLALTLTALTTPFGLVGVLDYNTVFGPGTTILSADLGQQYCLRTWDNNTVSGHSRTILFAYLGRQYCLHTWDNNSV